MTTSRASRKRRLARYASNGTGLNLNPEAAARKVIGTTGLKNFAGRISEDELAIFRSWSKEAQIYLEMRDDVIIGTLLDAVKLPLLAAEFVVDSASESAPDQRAKEFIEDNIANMHHQTWRSHVEDMLETLEFGFAVGEIVLEKRHDGRMWIRNIESRGQETLDKWIFDNKDNLISFQQRDPVRGSIATIPISKMVHMTMRGRKGNPQGRSILRWLWWPYRFRRDMENLEGIGVERDIGGMPVATMGEASYDPDDLTKLDDALAGMRMDERMFLRLPSGVKVEPYGGGSKSYNIGEIIERKKKEILMRLFAQFLMLGMESVGSQALVQGSQDFFTLGEIAIQQVMLESWNQQLIPYLLRHNSFTELTGNPTLNWKNPGKVNIAEIMEAYTKGSSSGVLTPSGEDEEHLRALLDLPSIPDDVLAQPREQPAAPGGFDLAQALSERLGNA